MDPKLLRDATRPEHEATESVVPLMRPDLSLDEYVAVLQRFAKVVCAWDAFAEKTAPEHLKQMVAARRRSASLAKDLEFFGIVLDEGQTSLDLQQQMKSLTMHADRTDPSRFLGAMYVVEGSALGGRYIAAHAERVLGLQPGQGDRYFRGYDDQTMPMWREFQQAITAVPEDRSDAVIEAARQMFGVFQRVLESGGSANAGKNPA